MIFVNFKTYEEGSGHKAVGLARLIEEIAFESQIKIVPVVQLIDAEMVANSVKIEVWVQHVDPVSYGPHTGWTLPEELVRIGIKGVFLNHSEHKFQDFSELTKAVARCREVDLKTLVFAEDLDELEKVCGLLPTYISYEPEELIGSTDSSVASAKPEIVIQASEIAKNHGLPLIVGAGINSMKDVVKSRELGAVGIAVAKDILKAENPRTELEDLVEGFK